MIIDNTVVLSAICGGAAVVLAVTGVAKLWGIKNQTLIWPQGKNFGFIHLPAGLVIVIEFLATAVYVFGSDIRLVSAVLGIIWLSISVGAITLRGEKCGCFGVINPPVGKPHIAMSLFTGLFLIAGAFNSDHELYPRTTISKALLVLFSVLVAFIAMLVITQSVTDKDHLALRNYERLVIVTSTSCSVCEVLHRLEYYDREPYVDWYTADELKSVDTEAYDEIQGKGFPLAIPVFSTGRKDYSSVVSGLQPVRKLLSGFRGEKVAGERIS